MIDTIKLILRAEEAEERKQLFRAAQYLENPTERINRETGEATGINGNLKNLQVYINPNYLKIENSLCKYLIGDNVKRELDCLDIAAAIQLLSDTLHLPINQAEVSRIDIGANVELKEPPQVYLPRLGNLRYYKRLLMDNKSLYYRQSEKEINLYDKAEEARKDKIIIPESKSPNLMRIEQRFKRHAARHLKISPLRAANLSNPAIYRELVNQWESTFKTIQIITPPTMELSNILTKKALYNIAIVALSEQTGGIMEIFRVIDENRLIGTMSKQTAANIKQTIKRAYEEARKANKEINNFRMDELTQAVEATAARLRDNA